MEEKEERVKVGDFGRLCFKRGLIFNISENVMLENIIKKLKFDF